MRRLRLIALLALTVVGVLSSIGSAQAGAPDSWQYKSSFGEELNTTFGAILVNDQTGNLLVMASDGKIHQFDSTGKPVDFAATGSPTLSVSGKMAIANGGGATQGNIYVFDGTYIHSFHADGSVIGVYEPISEGRFLPDEPPLINPGGMFATGDGTLWVVANIYDGTAEVYPATPETAPTAPVFRVPASLGGGPSPSVSDGAGHLWTAFGFANNKKFDESNKFAFISQMRFGYGGEDRQIAVDPSTHYVYRVADSSVDALPSDAEEHTQPIDVLDATDGLNGAGGIGFDGTGNTMYISEKGKIRIFRSEPPSPPREIGAPLAGEIRAYGAVLRSSFVDGGAVTTYRFEYGPTTEYGTVSETFTAPHKLYSQIVRGAIKGLEPDTRYHFRIVATNSAGTTDGTDGTFKTYPIPPGTDDCPNALARKQTVAERLPDCRAYELASAPYTGGYDVESSLVAGLKPYPGFPDARDRVLYGTHSGAVPGPWNATNKGPDPYVATRTENGWVTKYEGLPSDLNPEAGPFSSIVGEADPSLSTLAFAGPGLCSPCFGSGLKTGIPVRMPNGSLVQGMSGSLAGSVPATAMPEGKIAKYFSGNGEHLVFASKYAFEPGANTSGTDLTVYDRDLSTGTTQIASTDQSGKALTGTVSELDISSDGSRIVTATKSSTDPAGNELVHPYMHIGSAASSVSLAPGATSGVRYAGMTADGSKVFFTTTDALLGSDTDTSADLYEAAVDGSGNVDLSAITGSSSNACNPVSNENGAHWNTTGATANCDAVAISGGGGVGSTSGAIYFLSPEQLESGRGTANQPNLYLAQPGAPPSFVATLEPDNPLVLDSVKANAARRTADFQTTPSGNYAAFTNRADLTELRSGDFAGLYRFAAGTHELNCVSCDLTGTDEPVVFGNAELPSNGLALLPDGRLFFTTPAQLLLNDANVRTDVYEFVGGKQDLISSGTSPFNSALIGVSADGTDAFFFTHDALASEEDNNGSLTRIYDARELGGFFKLPPGVPCQASDECHGPSSPLPPPSDIKSSGVTTPGNIVVCAKNRIKKRNQCVKKASGKKKHQQKKKKGKRGGRNA